MAGRRLKKFVTAIVIAIDGGDYARAFDLKFDLIIRRWHDHAIGIGDGDGDESDIVPIIRQTLFIDRKLDICRFPGSFQFVFDDNFAAVFANCFNRSRFVTDFPNSCAVVFRKLFCAERFTV